MSDPRRVFAVEVVKRLSAAGFQALWAGGCVRDLLMSREPGDYDVATNATPEQVRQVFGARRTIPVGESFGVIIVRGPSPAAGQIEVATFRSEGPYSDGRRPDHVAYSTAEQDAQRRDFTINGMFYDPVDETILDYVGGEADLKARRLRAIGEPHARIREDKLRMLRAVRFAAILDFELDATTTRAISDMAVEVTLVSAERIAQELQKMLSSPNRRRAVELAESTGLLPVILPELALVAPTGSPDRTEWSQTLAALEQLKVARFELAMAMLLRLLPAAPPAQDRRTRPSTTDAVESEAGTVWGICRRLRLSNEQTENIVWLVASQREVDGIERAEPWQWKRFLQQPHAPELLRFLSVLRSVTGEDTASVDYLIDLHHRMTPQEINPPLLVSGDDLKNAGLRPGPRFRELLDAVRNAQLNGEVETREQALAWLERNGAASE